MAKVAAWVNLIVIGLFFILTIIPSLVVPFFFVGLGVLLGVNSLKEWWWNPLLIWDTTVNVMTNGSPYNTISARTGFWAAAGCPVAQVMAPVIDRVMFEKDHCHLAFRGLAENRHVTNFQPFPFTKDYHSGFLGDVIEVKYEK